VHESIGQQVSASGSGSKGDTLTTIEHTSFGGPAQNCNAARSRAEQMAAQRRVSVTGKKEKRKETLNSKFGFALSFQLRQIVASSQRRGSRTDSNDAVEERPKVYLFVFSPTTEF
jgi:hypothetical protein